MELTRAHYIKDQIPIACDDSQEIYVTDAHDTSFEDRVRFMKSTKRTGKFFPLPYINIKQDGRSALYISSPSGAGKSSFAAYWITELRRFNKIKNYPVFLFTTAEDDDKAYDNIDGFNKVNINAQDFMDLTSHDLIDSICVFDDWQVHHDKAIEKKMYILVNDCLQHGRKLNIQVIVCTHQTSQYLKTRDIIFESDTFCLFPSANPNSVIKFLVEKCDMTKKDALKILELNTRHIIVHKAVPRYIVADDCIILL